MPKTLEFFFDYASPYSYLASTQVEALCARAGAELSWKPVLLGAIFKATENVSPAANMVKAQYLLKDLERWTRHYGLPALAMPESFIVNAIKADRAALVAIEQRRISALTRVAYRAAFQKGEDLSDEQVLRRVLAEAELDPDATLARIETQAVKDKLRANTDEAVARGAFGVPTFFVGDEMYVGNDRLTFVEAALAR